MKVDIVFHGDVVNTTARLERMCSELGEILLISQDFYDTLPDQFKNVFERAEAIRLKGKEKQLQIYHLKAKKDSVLSSTPDVITMGLNS